MEIKNDKQVLLVSKMNQGKVCLGLISGRELTIKERKRRKNAGFIRIIVFICMTIL